MEEKEKMAFFEELAQCFAPHGIYIGQEVQNSLFSCVKKAFDNGGTILLEKNNLLKEYQ